MRPELDARIIDGEIVIRLSIRIVATAARGLEAFEHIDEETDEVRCPKITDAAKFAEAVVVELNRDSEDGSTLLTNMFDEAFQAAAEWGAEGIVFPDEDEYTSAVEPEA